MTQIATFANQKLTDEFGFIFEAVPNNNKQMYIYMYYSNYCTRDAIGTEILVYKQVVTRGDDGVWFADGTFVGRSVVGNYFAGGNKELTIDAYGWKSGAPTCSNCDTEILENLKYCLGCGTLLNKDGTVNTGN